MFTEICVLVGIVTLGRFVYHWSLTLFSFFLAKPLGFTVDVRKLGDWAVVTGSTDGIGKAFARELASRGLNIVLISRDRTKLENTRANIEKDFKVDTRIVVADFANGVDCYREIRQVLTGLPVGVLVNNIGMLLKYPEYFHLIPDGEKTMLGIIRCNVVAVTMMSRICLPGMVERRKGAIINVASASALLPTPLVSVYSELYNINDKSASKAYVDFLSRSLQQEYSNKGIIIQSLLPFTVSTKMTGNPSRDYFVPGPQEFVHSSLNCLGLLSRSHGYPTHSLQGWYYSSLPEWISQHLQWKFFTGLRASLIIDLHTLQENINTDSVQI